MPATSTRSARGWCCGSDEFLNDGPTKQDLTLAESYCLMHFGMDHYDGSSTSVAAGEAWSKTFGPYLCYLNSGATGARLLGGCQSAGDGGTCRLAVFAG